MAKTIIEIEGKRFQVCRSAWGKIPCIGCYFYDNENMITTCKKMPCLEFDSNSEYYHILKELQ